MRDRLGPLKIQPRGKGPGFGLPLKGAVSLKARQVKSA